MNDSRHLDDVNVIINVVSVIYEIRHDLLKYQVKGLLKTVLIAYFVKLN